MHIRVVTDDGQQVAEPFLVRLAGWTEERYFAEAPEDRLWEFHDGEVIVHSPATPGHQRLVRFLTFLLSGFVEERGLGEVLNGPAVLRLRPGANKEPDVFFVAREDAGRITSERVEGAAAFVIEVASQGSRNYDLGEKAQLYEAAGVAEYWVIDGERREVVVHHVGEADYRVAVITTGHVASKAVPGFWLNVAWLWQEPLPSAPSCLREVLGNPPA